MAKELETDTDAEGRRHPYAEGRGRPQEEPRPPTPVCLRFKPWSVGPRLHRLGAPTQKTTKAFLLSLGRGAEGREL